MEHQNPILTILNSIAISCSATSGVPLTETQNSDARIFRLATILNKELGISLTPNEVRQCSSISTLGLFVQTRLGKNSSGKSLIDIYLELEEIAREEYHPKIPFAWCAKWTDFLKTGNWLTRPDGLDSVEVVIRLEAKYRIAISDTEAKALETVGQTVRYLWARGV
jgi:acyl carrier protein